MWIKRDIINSLTGMEDTLPVRVLKGPRQTGKTSLLGHLPDYRLVSLDDAATRSFAQDQPRLFLDQLGNRLILDEATLAPNLFFELKRRVDEYRLKLRKESPTSPLSEPVPSEAPQYWVTGSNQTLLRTAVQESLAGRATYFDLNTLAVHELGPLWSLESALMKGGWPELYVSPHLTPERYLNDFIASFIEHDIVAAAGIEKRAAFFKILGLSAGRVGQLLNASDIGRTAGVESSTVHSWLSILEQNGILRSLPVYSSNLNQRLIKTPKLYFEDTALATRLQGWTQSAPLLVSPYFGAMVENIALTEISRAFTNRGRVPRVHLLRTKDQVEVDFLIELPNQRWIAAEVKSSPQPMTDKQLQLIDSLKLNIVDHWVISLSTGLIPGPARVIPIPQIWEELSAHF